MRTTDSELDFYSENNIANLCCRVLVQILIFKIVFFAENKQTNKSFYSTAQC